MVRPHLLVVLVLALIAAAVPASAEPVGDTWTPGVGLPFEPVREETTVWFICDGDTPEATVNQRLGNPTPTWAFERPEDSVMDGHGCGSGNPSAVNGTEQESPYDLSFAGEVTGQLEDLTVTLHNGYLGTARRTNPTQMIDVRLTIDGLSVFGVEDRTGTDVDGGTFETVTHTQPKIRRMALEPLTDGVDDIAPRFQFSITGLDYLADEDDTTHRVVLTISTPAGGGNAQNLWLWGANEIDSRIVFNARAEATWDNVALPREEREPHDH
jgi:hypothetical protein